MLQRFAEEALGCRQAAVPAEPELDRVADAVDGAVEIHPLTSDLDVGLIRMPFPGHRPLAPVEALIPMTMSRSVSIAFFTP